MNRKEMFTKLSERAVSESLHNRRKKQVPLLAKPISKLMLWAYEQGVNDGINMVETELENAV
jgi:hypothetical protein